VLLGTTREIAAWFSSLHTTDSPADLSPATLAEGFLRLSDRPPLVVIKAGDQGAWLVTDRVLAIDPAPTTVVDTTGAGDAFTAGFLQAWVAGQSPQTAAQRASVLAARAVTHHGGQPPTTEGHHGDS
jgi:sugar/nucleoside kinase (ribokinase family)